MGRTDRATGAQGVQVDLQTEQLAVPHPVTSDRPRVFCVGPRPRRAVTFDSTTGRTMSECS
jgi:hypothetical protein